MSKKKKDLPVTYGGQAVMEGVMMRGKHKYCVAVRNPQGEIEVRYGESAASNFMRISNKIPIFRGVVKLGSSMLMGMKVMKDSAEMAGLDDEIENPSKFDTWLEKKFGDKLTNVLLGVALIVSLAFSVGLFMVLPTWLSSLLPVENARLLGVVEGLVRLLIFIGYLLLISRMKDIKRVFEYHGAEHMVINCYEAGAPLTPESAKGFSRLHKRCGTSFLLFVMLISMVFFLFVNTDVVWLRVASRILFVPVIAGISFEVIRWAGISNSPIVKILSWPGFMMQRITTAVPNEKQLEVAIMALNGVIAAEASANDVVTVSNLRRLGRAELWATIKNEHERNTDTDVLLMLALGLGSNDFLLAQNENASIEARQKFREYIARRKTHEPVQYIVGSWVFMSINLQLSRNTLIPRSDTEVLVNAVLDNQHHGLRGLEIGVGSGAVSIALEKHGEFCMLGSDICKEAIKVANTNYQSTFDSKAEPFIWGNLFDAFELGAKFDFIVSNPPYIPSADVDKLDESVRLFEPRLALDGGADGLDFYRSIVADAPIWLKPGGRLYFEIGHDQATAVSRVLSDAGFSEIKTVKDLSGHDRVIHGGL